MWSRLASNRILQQNIAKCTRSYGDGAPPMKLLRKYEHFQQDNGIPVYLKGGAMDKVLFGITLISVGIGLSDGFYTLFKMAFSKKK